MPNIHARAAGSVLGQHPAGDDHRQTEALQPSFINQNSTTDCRGGSTAQLSRQLEPQPAARNLNMPLQERVSNRAPVSQDDHDSFDSNADDPYGNREVDTDNSLLKSSMLDKQPPSQLQTKLSQVKNVFTAIRKNLNDGSTN
jgi:hypothetical protein